MSGRRSRALKATMNRAERRRSIRRTETAPAVLASIPFVGRLLPAPTVHRYWSGPDLDLDVGPHGTTAIAVIERYKDGLPPNAIRYDGPEVFYKGLSLTERFEKAKKARKV